LARGLLIHGNVRVLAVTSLVTGAYLSVLNAILQPFVVQNLGFSVAVLGVMVSIGARPSGLASSIVQPFAGHFADLVGRKVLIVSGSAVAIASMVSFLLAATTHSLLPLAACYFLFGLSLLNSPATQAMIAESVAMDPGKVDVAFSVVFFFTQLPGAFIPFAAGYLASSFGYLVIFGAAAVLESANLVVLTAKLRETRQHPRLGDQAQPKNAFSLRQAVRLPPGFLRIFAPFAMDAFSFGLAGSIIYGIWVTRFRFSPGDIGLIVGALSVSIVVSQYPATTLLLRFGPRKSLAFSEALTVVVLLGWLVTISLPVFIVLAVVFGVSVSTLVPAQSSLLMTRAPPEERGSVGGKLAAFRGLVAVPAPILGGFLFSAFGYYVPVALSLVGEAFTIIAILELLPERPRSP
jgi:MFS family permease